MEYTKENYCDLKIQEFENLSVERKKYISINKALILLDLLKDDLMTKHVFDEQDYKFIEFLRKSLIHGVQMYGIKALSNMYRFDVIDNLLYIDYDINENIEAQSVLIRVFESNLALSCREDTDKWMIPYNKFTSTRFILRIDIKKFIEEVKTRLDFNVKEEVSELVDSQALVCDSSEFESRIDLNVKDKFLEIVDNHSMICGSSNELVYLKFAIKEYLNYSFDFNFSGLTESIILSSPILYDYVFRSDTSTGIKYNIEYTLEDKIAYKLIRNLIVHESTILDKTNFQITELNSQVIFIFDDLPEKIFKIELSSVNSEYICIKNGTIVVNIKKALCIVDILINKLIQSIINNCNIAIQADTTEEDDLKKEKQLTLMLLNENHRAKPLLDHVYKTIYEECTRFVLELLYFIFICIKIIDQNNENKEVITRFIEAYFECTSEYHPKDFHYTGNAYDILSSGGKSINSGLIKFIKNYDNIFESKFAGEFKCYLDQHDIKLEEYSGIDLYKNILIKELVIYDLIAKSIIIN